MVSNAARDHQIFLLDLFLWRYRKYKMYATEPEFLGDLRNRIINEYQQITADILQKVREHFMKLNGEPFPHVSTI